MGDQVRPQSAGRSCLGLQHLGVNHAEDRRAYHLHLCSVLSQWNVCCREAALGLSPEARCSWSSVRGSPSAWGRV